MESKLLSTFFGMTDLNKTPKKWEQEFVPEAKAVRQEYFKALR